MSLRRADPLTTVQEFAYRRPRLRLEQPVEFWVATGVIHGESKDVSDAGVLVRLAEPVSLGTHGRLRWQFGGCLVEIGAYVAHTDFIETGLHFEFRSADERQFVQTLLKLLSKGPRRK